MGRGLTLCVFFYYINIIIDSSVPRLFTCDFRLPGWTLVDMDAELENWEMCGLLGLDLDGGVDMDGPCWAGVAIWLVFGCGRQR